MISSGVPASVGVLDRGPQPAACGFFALALRDEVAHRLGASVRRLPQQLSDPLLLILQFRNLLLWVVSRWLTSPGLSEQPKLLVIEGGQHDARET